MKRLISLLAVLVTFTAAQDFGYETTVLSEYRSFGFGYNTQNFRASSSNTLHDTDRIAFSTNMPMLELRQDNGRLAIGYQSYTDRNGKSKKAYSVFGETHNDIPLTGSKGSRSMFAVPIAVSANYVKADAQNRTYSNFDIGSLGVGTGIKYRYFDRSFGLQAFVVGSLYYASEGFSTNYGSQTSLAGEVQLVFGDLLFDGILIGCRYEFQKWNMSDSAMDYQRQHQGAFIGILF
ncbi:MAG: hypothetical protein ACOYNS_14885 [Bacteroidota bacterium]